MKEVENWLSLQTGILEIDTSSWRARRSQCFSILRWRILLITKWHFHFFNTKWAKNEVAHSKAKRRICPSNGRVYDFGVSVMLSKRWQPNYLREPDYHSNTGAKLYKVKNTTLGDYPTIYLSSQSLSQTPKTKSGMWNVYGNTEFHVF